MYIMRDFFVSTRPSGRVHVHLAYLILFLFFFENQGLILQSIQLGKQELGVLFVHTDPLGESE